MWRGQTMEGTAGGRGLSLGTPPEHTAALACNRLRGHARGQARDPPPRVLAGTDAHGHSSEASSIRPSKASLRCRPACVCQRVRLAGVSVVRGPACRVPRQLRVQSFIFQSDEKSLHSAQTEPAIRQACRPIRSRCLRRRGIFLGGAVERTPLQFSVDF